MAIIMRPQMMHTTMRFLLPGLLASSVASQDAACSAGSFVDSDGACATCPAGRYDAVPDAAGACALDEFVTAECTAALALDLPLLGDVTESEQSLDAVLTGHAMTTICDGTCGLVLDGEGDRATVPHFDYANDGTYTYSFWMTKEACTGNSWEYVYSHNKDESSIGSPLNSGINTFLSCGNSYIRSIIVSNTGQAIQWDYDMHGSASFDAVTAKWIHFVMALDNPAGSMYIDGQAVNPGTELSAFGNGMPWGMPNLAGRTAGFMSAFSEPYTGSTMGTDLHLGSRFDRSGARHFIGQIAGVRVSTDTVCASGALSWFAEGLCTLATTGCFGIDTGSECAGCPAGRFGETTGQTGIAASCTASCPTGKFAASGSTACVDCGPGRYDHDSSSATPCAECPGGKYGSSTGATDIVDACDSVCPQGTFAPQGSGSLADCRTCSTGKYDGDSDPSTPCSDCPAGRFSGRSTGQLSCTGECPAGTYSAPSSVTALDCTACASGTYDNDNDSSTMCTSCPQGTYPLYIVMTDTWGDGWQGNQATITNCDGSVIAHGLTLPGGLKSREDVCLPLGAEGFRVYVNGGQCKGEVGWTVFEEDGTQLARGSSPYDDWTGTCPSTNCTGQWSTCDESCTRTYLILSPETGPAGPTCPFADGDVGSCSSGDGQCGTSCSSSSVCPAGSYCRSGTGAMGSCEACSDASGECGCTDRHSPNFSATAAQDDGSCHYGVDLCTIGTGWSCYTSSSCASVPGACGEYASPTATGAAYTDLAEAVGFDGTTLAGGSYVWRFVRIASQVLTTTNRFAFKFMDSELGEKPNLSITRTYVDDVDVNGRLIAVYSGKMHIAYSSFNNVRGGTGAVLYVFGDEATISFTSITSCTASADDFGTGGGAVGFEGGTMKIRYVTFSGNSVDNAGGALKINRAIGSVVEIDSSLFAHNFAPLTGGAIDVRNDVSLSIYATKFIGNQAGAKTDEANSCWRSSNGDCGYLTGICAIGTDTDDCSSGDHLFVHLPHTFYASNTSFHPYDQTSVYLTYVADCETYPCDPGYSCRYYRHSLQCTPCEGRLVGLDGKTCVACPAGQGPSADNSACEVCPGNELSLFGYCTPCPVGQVAEETEVDYGRAKLRCGDLGTGDISDPAVMRDILTAGTNADVQTTMRTEVREEELVVGTSTHRELLNGLRSDFANALGLSPDDVAIANLRPATAVTGRRTQFQPTATMVTVDFDLVLESNDTQQLLQQLQDPSSAIMSGRWTGSIQRVAVSFSLICNPGQVREAGEMQCSRCRDDQIPNDLGDRCKDCPPEQTANEFGTGCICRDGYYNRTIGTFWCYSPGLSFNEAHFEAAKEDKAVCRQCDTDGVSDCVDCENGNGTAVVKDGYSPNTAQKRQPGPMDALVGMRPLFRCKIDGQCIGEMNGSELGCSPPYDGPLCSNCAEGYARSGLSRSNVCELCSGGEVYTGPVGLLLLLGVTFYACFNWIQVKTDESEIKGKRGAALLIANTEYAHWPRLTHAALDARRVGQVLIQANFAVVEVFNADTLATHNAVASFVATLEALQKDNKRDIPAFVFFSGHGCQLDEQNQLIPVDCAVNPTSNDIRDDCAAVQVGAVGAGCIPVQVLLESIGSAKRGPSIIVLEAAHEIEEHMPDDLLCAITKRLMVAPVRLVAQPEGPCYEQSALQQHVQVAGCSPSGQHLQDAAFELDEAIKERITEHWKTCTLRKMEVPQGVAMMLTAASGTMATAMTANHGTFAEAFVQSASNSAAGSVVSMLHAVRKRVVELSAGRQVPWVVSTLNDENSISLMVERDATGEDGSNFDDEDNEGAQHLGMVLDLLGWISGRIMTPNVRSLAPNLRTTIGLTQILNGIQFAFYINFPPGFEAALNAMKVLALDVLDVFRLGCSGSWTYSTKFFSWTIAPPCIVAGMFLMYRWHSRALTADDPIRHKMFDRLLILGFNFVFLTYPVVCQTIFQAFLCQDLGNPAVAEESYLSVDFQTNCDSTAHIALQATAVIMVFVYPIGIPAVIFAVLFRARKELSVEGSEMRDFLDPLVGSYRVGCYYWEALEMTRKVILTGLMIYWAPGTVQQLLIGSTISAVYMVRIDAYAVAQERPQGVAILKQPYLTPFNNRFKTVTDAAICLTFNIAVLLSSHVQDPSSDNMFYISSDLLVVALFAVNFIVPASLVAHEIRKFYGERLIGSFSNTSTADEAAQAAKEPSDAHAPVNPTADLMQAKEETNENKKTGGKKAKTRQAPPGKDAGSVGSVAVFENPL